MGHLTSLRAMFSHIAWPLAFGAAMLLLPQATDDPAFARVIPWFVVLIALQVAPAMLSPRVDLFEPPVSGGLVGAFSSFSAVLGFFVVGGLEMETLHSVDPMETADLVIQTVLAMIVATLGYYVGYYGPFGRSFKRIFPNLERIAWTPSRLLRVTLIPILLFVVAYVIFQARVGVSLYDVTELARGKATWRQDPTLSWMLRGVELGLVPALLFFTWAVTQRSVRPLVVTGVIFAVVALLVLRLGQRGPMALGALIAVVVFHYLRRRISVTLFVSLYFLGIVASNIAYHWRVDDPESIPKTHTVENVLDDPAMVLTTHESERKRFSTLAMVIDAFPDDYPYLLGESFVPIFTAVVPRWLWPGKADHYVWKDDRIIFQISGIPAPTPYVGVLYANFAWLGIVLGTVLLGLFHRGLYTWRGESPKNPGVALIYGLMTVYFTPGSLGVSALLQYVLPVWLLVRLMGRAPPSAEDAAPAPQAAAPSPRSPTAGAGSPRPAPSSPR